MTIISFAICNYHKKLTNPLYPPHPSLCTPTPLLYCNPWVVWFIWDQLDIRQCALCTDKRIRMDVFFGHPCQVLLTTSNRNSHHPMMQIMQLVINRTFHKWQVIMNGHSQSSWSIWPQHPVPALTWHGDRYEWRLSFWSQECNFSFHVW